MASRIEDYALIGDCHTAALVGRDGSIDWLCLPRFDSGACFAALLGAPEHGRWRIAPVDEPTRITRRYRGDTLILETDFETATGRVTLVDCMPLRSDACRLVRLVIGRSGTVKMHAQLIVRFDYGSIVPWVWRADHRTHAVAGADALVLDTPVELRGENLTTVADFTVREGETVPFVATWYASPGPAPAPIDAVAWVKEAEQWWRDWAGRCTYNGPWRDAVMRSLITLKALTFAPTGGIVAAPTTSLPEQLGGVRNWDYRYCWLRDATFTLYALMHGRYVEEARAWRQWLVRAVAGTPSQVNILYGIGGERRLPEIELDWLPGYEGARPVRTGNAAHSQRQLDVFGEVAATMHLARATGLGADKITWNVQTEMIGFLCKAWKEPDEGIWEVRGPPRHFVHSKVMAWLAMDRSIRSAEQFGLEAPLDEWKRVRTAIHEDVCRRGYDAARGTFVQYYGSSALDASLVMIPLAGFLPPDDPRVLGTIAAVERELMVDGFVLRYPTRPHVDGLPPGEGVFLACTLWLANALALMGRLDDAHKLFERVLALSNDVGLLSEEYDTHTRRLVGNFPQALTHVSLINTAFRLAGVDGKTGL